ncbi:TetR/AcrR family transcriptional regulator [Mucilaginibacter aquaedulcis]|uniref:TetR/AcrR family transcriptional regulator n=1 Tax=Mucilaginibacter aquaedulcis TaxID=1187081 RepID=UPI0025B33EA2|nr:TetR/AcrR family transcriptional regulator [Mucilaginibacter aquaedulcis]MDN3547458.1 TetR/AcrR family transcriptional regulator [Mucilaginibacter aquaedulcis]
MEATLHTRDKIVELARGYIQTVGYHAFNYKQIATVLNIKNAAIHHYYPSKEDLGLAVIEKDKNDFECMIAATANDEPIKKLEALIYIYERYFYDGHKLCLISTFGSAYHDIPAKIQQATIQYSNMIQDWLVGVMQEGLDIGAFKFEGTAEEMANKWAAILPGSLQVGRWRGEAYFKEIMNSLLASLKST